MHAHGTHDYNAQPFAPMGCAVQLFETPEARKSWDPHSIDRYSLGCAMEHYRNQVVWVNKTKAERISDTAWFKHKYLTNPSMTAADRIVHSAKELTDALFENKPKQLSPGSNSALAKLAQIFNEAAIKYSNKEANKNVRLPGVDRSKKNAAIPGVQQTATRNGDAILGVPSKQDNNQPRYNLQRREERSITTEAMLSAIKITSVPLKAKNLACRRYPLQMMCELAGAVLDPKTGELMEYRHLIAKPEYCEVWSKANAKEIGRLAQGIPGVVEGTNTFFFQAYEDIS
jgi:hypothetical protein